ncbi:hypothetical protein BFS35_011140 [Macrococcoides goetzii]|uniref:Uncharacterized protein n=1 Tax=Macrococcoides goetzii TaxID=1891097 RepID=A0A2G5NW53_9STAP|nr:hypothetical protein [Macrococcus goetzii]RAI79693.1 hypothetical protein BFS35_011140 [Macrococcus goetzii]
MPNIYALYSGNEVLAVDTSRAIMDRFNIKPSHFWSIANERARKYIENNPDSKSLYVIKVEDEDMKNSLNRKIVRRNIVEKPTEIYEEEIIEPKVIIKKHVPLRERKLTGYAAFCFNLHFGGWQS